MFIFFSDLSSSAFNFSCNFHFNDNYPSTGISLPSVYEVQIVCMLHSCNIDSFSHISFHSFIYYTFLLYISHTIKYWVLFSINSAVALVFLINIFYKEICWYSWMTFLKFSPGSWIYHVITIFKLIWMNSKAKTNASEGMCLEAKFF